METLFWNTSLSDKLFYGKWDTKLKKRSGTDYNDTSTFKLIKYSDFFYENLTFFNATVYIQNSWHIRFDRNKMNFIGTYYQQNQQNYFFLFRVLDSSHSDYFNYSYYSSLLNSLIPKTYTINHFEKKFSDQILNDYFDFTINTICLSPKDISYNHKYFDSDQIYKGMYKSSLISINLELQERFIDKLFIECKKYAVFCSLGFILLTYLWIYLRNSFSTVSSISQLSIETLTMLVSFDICFHANILVNCSRTRKLFLVGFFILTLYGQFFLYVQLVFILHVWNKQVIARIQGITPTIRKYCARVFLIKSSIILALTVTSFQLILDYPQIPLVFLCSAFLPQIYKNAKSNDSVKNLSFFVFLITILRLAQLSYFCIYKQNIFEMYHNILYIYLAIYMIAQLIIIILQTIFGGRFFLPKSKKSTTYNYKRLPLPEGSECSICYSPILSTESGIITPCGHTFHIDCIKEWLKESDLCPYCRQVLPNIVLN